MIRICNTNSRFFGHVTAAPRFASYWQTVYWQTKLCAERNSIMVLTKGPLQNMKSRDATASLLIRSDINTARPVLEYWSCTGVTKGIAKGHAKDMV